MRGPPSSGRTRSKGGAGGWCGCRSCPALRRPSCSRGCAARHLEGPAMKLLVATRNEGKIREIRDLFTGLPFELTFPVDQFLERLPDEADLERGTSFAENAVAKARYFAKRGTIPTLAGDSGAGRGAGAAVPLAPFGPSVRMKRLHSRLQIGRLGLHDSPERRDVDPHRGRAGDHGGREREAPHARVVRQLGHATPQKRGGLGPHLRRGRAEQCAHGQEGAGPRGPCQQGGGEGSHNRQPKETRHWWIPGCSALPKD